ncbi:DUF4870 domain-containing protein [Sporomusa malonica]|uniref:DUF4870 domain-containing protein n=1 Tax=Sporomusa malonica TaxID=112901 RepID=A0A1W2E7H3_9FIRM|nr:DUF4870 domain-containing protein [Sporomusa malonica]SMD05497.1 hypothetical protein SAMN04488500_12165 [Sporomusa malonica]
MNITGEQKLLAVLAHLAYLFGGLGFIIAPLLIFLAKKDDPFVYEHAKQALVAHLVILAVSVATGLLCALLIGLLLLPIIAVLWLLLLITSIIAAVKAADGQGYKYPIIQGLVNKI